MPESTQDFADKEAPKLSINGIIDNPKDVLGWLSLGLSALLHPLLQPTLLFAIVFYGVDGLMPVSEDTKKQLLLLIFVFTFGLPMLGIYLLHLIGYVRDLRMADRRERILPLMLSTFIYAGITWLFMQNLRSSTSLTTIMGAATASLAVTTVISMFWKISAHGVGSGGIIGTLLAIAYLLPQNELMYPIVALSIIIGALLSARLYLDAHTPAQIAAGFGLGFIIGFSVIKYFL